MAAFDKSARTQPSAPEPRIRRWRDTPATEALAAQSEMLAGSPRVQSQLQLQRAMDASPRLVAQAKLADEINSRHAAVQRADSDDEEEKKKKSDDEEKKKSDDGGKTPSTVPEQFDAYMDRLVTSTPEDPLPADVIAKAAAFVNTHRRDLPADRRRELAELIRIAEDDLAGKQRSAPKTTKKRRRVTPEEKDKRPKRTTFDNESGS